MVAILFPRRVLQWGVEWESREMGRWEGNHARCNNICKDEPRPRLLQKYI